MRGRAGRAPSAAAGLRAVPPARRLGGGLPGVVGLQRHFVERPGLAALLGRLLRGRRRPVALDQPL
jgi:hypothetical protein